MVLKQVAEEIGRAGWGTVLVFSLCAVGVITVSESLSNALVDTGFYFIRISNEPVWVALLTPFGLRTGTWFTFCSMVVTSIAALIIIVQLSAHLPGGARAYLRFGSFSWWLLPLLLVAPVLFAAPQLFLTRLFGIGPPIYFPTSYLDIAASTFLMSVMVPIREEIIWRGLYPSKLRFMA